MKYKKSGTFLKSPTLAITQKLSEKPRCFANQMKKYQKAYHLSHFIDKSE